MNHIRFPRLNNFPERLLATRAQLWSTVYLSPENRFRVILLRTVLREMRKRPALRNKGFEDVSFELDADSFLTFDDAKIDALIDRLASSQVGFNGNAAQAIKILSSGNSQYEYRWVRFDGGQGTAANSDKPLPDQFYYDLYSDYEQHSLYDQGTIRVAGSRYKALKGDTINLEECVGPFSAVLKAPWSAHPMPDHMTWFQPRDPRYRSGSAWTALDQFASGTDVPGVSGRLLANDPMANIDFVIDTRQQAGFRKPDIFISFCWEDLSMVRRIVRVLHQRKRCYYVLSGPYAGLGGAPVKNSREAVQNADAVILLYSERYAKRYHESQSGPIAGEIMEMTKIVGKKPIVPLSMESAQDLKEKLPWADLGFIGEIPMVGKALRQASDRDIQEAIDNALAYIDRPSAGEPRQRVLKKPKSKRQ